MTHTSTKRQFEEIVDDEIRTKNKVRQIEKNLMVELTARQPWWYRVYWLDEFTTCPLVDYGIDRLKLRGIIDYLQTYTSVDQLLGDIQRFEENNEKIIILLTISNTLDSFYQLDQFSQIHSIYIYALSSEENTIIDKINTHAKVILSINQLKNYKMFNRYEEFLMKQVFLSTKSRIIFVNWNRLHSCFKMLN